MAPVLHRFSVDEYERMAQYALLPEKGIELVDGLVVELSPRGDRHSWAVRELARRFILGERGRYRTDPESLSLRIDSYNEPDPDVTLSWPRADRRRPTPADVFLIIEVADSSLFKDRSTKSALYAGAGIPEYWIVDLARNCIERRSAPVSGVYTETAISTRGDVFPIALPDVGIDVAAVFGIDDP